MEEIKFYQEKFKELISGHVEFLEQDVGAKDTTTNQEWQKPETNSLSCSFCKVEFSDSVQHREHYKLDWHRYNLKQSLCCKSAISEEEFNERADDISSISGSDSEKEDSIENVSKVCGKLFLKNSQDKVFSLYRCLIFNKKDEVDVNLLSDRLGKLNSNWCIVMLGGGHFAGGIFNGSTPIVHKTFHCYTVRAGQGGTQSSRDNQTAGSHPKSAGSSLRRYNETAYIKHVTDIMESWKEEIAKCGIIIYRAPGPYNLAVLFGGKNSLFDRNDPRLKSIPFSTRRPTFTELKRVYDILVTVKVYDNLKIALGQEFNRKKNKSKSVKTVQEETQEEIVPSSDVIKVESSESDNDDGEIDLVTQNCVLELESLQEFGDSLTAEDRKKVKSKKPKKSKNQRVRERESARKKELFETIQRGDLDKLKELLEEGKIDEVLDEHGNTLLHLAASYQKVIIIKYLLDNNANVCVTNNRNQTPYTVTENKEVRLVFRAYASENPEKFNYNKAHIPINALTEAEKAEKKKQQRAVKREKEKEKRKENAIKKSEELDRARFLNLSDREKRALAAERRILNQSGSVITRCFLCATDISGKIPYEYSGNRFCSVECLKAHRLQCTKL